MANGKLRLVSMALIGVGMVVGSAHWPMSDGLSATQVRDALAFVPPANAADGRDLFAPVADVLRHPRCMNCHPVDDRPRQGDDRHPHKQNVVRGPDELGFVNMRCTSCHREENNQDSGVPGAPTWHLAPLSMGWQGLNDAQLCTTLKDEKRNGGKSIAALVEHMEKDKLVLWGWNPGGDRTPVPVAHDKFMIQLKAWAAANAPCPS
jgi:hypothetical protein